MTYRRLTIIVVFVLIGIAAYGLLMWMLYSFNTQTRTLVLETAERRAQIRDELSLKAFADDIRANTNVLEHVVISEKGEVDFIESLEKLGKSQGVTVAIASVKEVDKSPFNELALQLSADGTWTQLVHLVQLLEIMPTYVTIKSVDLHVLDGGAPAKKGKVVASEWRLALEISAIKTK